MQSKNVSKHKDHKGAAGITWLTTANCLWQTFQNCLKDYTQIIIKPIVNTKSVTQLFAIKYYALYLIVNAICYKTGSAGGFLTPASPPTRE